MKLIRKFAVVLMVWLLITQAFVVAARASVALPFTGVMVGHETSVFQPPNSLVVEGHGAGNATQLGRFAVAYTVTVNLADGSGPASAEFIAANSDRLFVEGFGQATDDPDTPGVVDITETFTITGGTGRFDGASGELTVHRKIEIATGNTFGTLTGEIVRVK